jgi:hypothetical protein
LVFFIPGAIKVRRENPTLFHEHSVAQQQFIRFGGKTKFIERLEETIARRARASR